MLGVHAQEGCGGSQEGQLRLGALVWVNGGKLIPMLICKACPAAEVTAPGQKGHRRKKSRELQCLQIHLEQQGGGN